MAHTLATVRAAEPHPQPGDVLVSKLSARIEHNVAIVPAHTSSLYANEASAVAEGVRLARESHVDAWLTQDYRHFHKIVSNRLDLRIQVRRSRVLESQAAVGLAIERGT